VRMRAQARAVVAVVGGKEGERAHRSAAESNRKIEEDRNDDCDSGI
jgi:hypothetical protein